MYAYQMDLLKVYTRLALAPLDHFDALDQLRVSWNGFAINVAATTSAPPTGVDTPEDFETVNNLRHAKIALIYL